MGCLRGLGVMSTDIVHPCEGFGLLRFGMTRSGVRDVLGNPDAPERFDEDGDLILEYPRYGIDYVCLDHEEGFRLSIIEVNADSRAQLWNLPIFESTFGLVQRRAKRQGHHLKPIAKYADLGDGFGYQIASLGLDFYFNDEHLPTSLCIGVTVGPDDEVVWPSDQGKNTAP
jgi:hypothetical protein